MDYIAQPKDYWIAQGAITITLNALGNPNRTQGSVASGAAILCYIEGVDGLGYDNGHRFKTWPLSLSPTYFNSNTQKYVYAAIPRTATVGTQAVVVFPSEKLDVYGKNSDGAQVGSSDYYYIWLQGIISSSGEYGTTNRTWAEEMDFGKKGTDEDLYDDTDGEWYQYSKVSEIVTFLKNITMKAGTTFYNLYLGYKELTGVATATTGEEYVDSETLVATPSYIHANYLRKNVEDTAEEQIGFLKGIWIGIKGLYEITADGVAKFKSLFVDDITAQRMQVEDMQSSNYTGDGIADTGWRLTKDYNGHSKLTIDELYVRMKAVFESLEVKKEMVTGGNQIFSRAANVICRTDYYNSDNEVIGYSEVKVPWLLRSLQMVLSKRILSGIYSKVRSVRISIDDPTEIAYIRCYFLAEEGGRKVNNLWSATGGHDLARCQTFNLNRSERKTYVDGEDVKLGNVFWWRKVISVSLNSSPVEIDGKKYHYFDVSNQSGGYMAGSDLPCAGDEVSQWGNDANEDRMHLVTIEVDGGVAIKAYEGIYTFDMTKCWYGGNPCKMNLSPQNEYRFTGRSFKIETEYGVRPVPVDIDVDWASQTKSRAEYAETGIAVGDLIVKNYYYDRVPHNGSLWLCLFTGNAYWARYAKYEGGTISYVTEDVFNTLTDSQKLYVKVNSRTGLADNQVCRRQEYATAQPGTNVAVWKQEVAKGQNGIDAQDVEWAYIRTKTNTPPVILNDSTYKDSNGKDYTEDEHLPHVDGNANIENNEGAYECTDDPKGIDDKWKYEWEIKRSKGAASDGHRTWNYYQGSMTLHGNFAESAFIIDTDNDNDQFGTDSDSKVLVQQVRKTTVALYDGADPQTLTALTATLTYEDGTSVPSGVAEVATTLATGVVAVTVKQNSTANTHSEIRANITATCSKGSKQTTFTLRKVMGGAPGLNPIIYQLAPVQKTFSFARGTSNILTPSSRSTQINVSKTEGNTTTILSTAQTGITFQWGFDVSATAEETGKAVGSSIEVTRANAGSHYQVWVLLSTGDRETLPIIKDGATGAMGDTPMQAYQWNNSPTTAPSPLPSGATLGNWSLTAPTRPTSAGEHYLWMTETVKHTSASGAVTYDTWSAATRVSGDDGAAGEDAVSIVISPASLIVNQDLNYTTNLSNLTEKFVVRVYKGSAEHGQELTVNGLSFVAETVPNSSPTAYKCLFLNGGGQRSGNSSIAGNELTLKEIRTYTQGGKTLYYDSMFVDVTATYNTNKTIKARVRIYANLLGTWAETVEADVKHEVATGKFYFEDSDGNVVAHETIGDYIKSSTQNISRLAKTIDDGKNLLGGVLTGEGWRSARVTRRWNVTQNDLVVDADGWMSVEEGYDYIASPIISLEAEKEYTFSFDAEGTEAILVYLLKNGFTDEGEYTSSGSTRRTIQLGGYESYRILISASSIKHPQLELGEVATAFDAGDTEVSSSIKQTAEEINLSVRSDVSGTNINLLYGVDGYTASNKLVHSSSGIDGFTEYSSMPHIFTSVQLVKGCTYTIQCVTDGTIAASHDGTSSHDPNDKLCTIWLRMNGLLNGGYNGECFTSQHGGYQNLGGGRHKWTFVCQKTGEYWFRTNSYSDGVTEVTINFWNIKLEGGSTATSFTGNTSQMGSEIKQTANSITARVETSEGDISELQLRADSITSRVETAENKIDKDANAWAVVDLTSLNANYFYPVSFDFGGSATSEEITCRVMRTLVNDYGVPSYARHANGFVLELIWRTKFGGWGTNVVNEGYSANDSTRYVSDYRLSWTIDDSSVVVAGSMKQDTRGSKEVVYLRGGSKYDVLCSRAGTTFTLHSGGYSAQYEESGQTVTVSFPVITDASQIIVPTRDAQTYSEIKQTADSIVATVTTKLGETGININGDNRVINLIAGKVNFLKSDNTAAPISIDTESGTLNTQNMVATNMTANQGRFTGIIVVDGTFSGTITNVDSDQLNKIIINTDPKVSFVSAIKVREKSGGGYEPTSTADSNYFESILIQPEYKEITISEDGGDISLGLVASGMISLKSNYDTNNANADFSVKITPLSIVFDTCKLYRDGVLRFEEAAQFKREGLLMTRKTYSYYNYERTVMLTTQSIRFDVSQRKNNSQIEHRIISCADDGLHIMVSSNNSSWYDNEKATVWANLAETGYFQVETASEVAETVENKKFYKVYGAIDFCGKYREDGTIVDEYTIGGIAIGGNYFRITEADCQAAYQQQQTYSDLVLFDVKEKFGNYIPTGTLMIISCENLGIYDYNNRPKITLNGKYCVSNLDYDPSSSAWNPNPEIELWSGTKKVFIYDAEFTYTVTENFQTVTKQGIWLQII